MKKRQNVCVLNPPKMTNLFVPNVYLNGKPLPYVDKRKYLGFNICNDLKDYHDMRQVAGLYTRGNMLVHKFNFCSEDVQHCSYRSYS